MSKLFSFGTFPDLTATEIYRENNGIYIQHTCIRVCDVILFRMVLQSVRSRVSVVCRASLFLHNGVFKWRADSIKTPKYTRQPSFVPGYHSYSILWVTRWCLEYYYNSCKVSQAESDLIRNLSLCTGLLINWQAIRGCLSLWSINLPLVTIDMKGESQRTFWNIYENSSTLRERVSFKCVGDYVEYKQSVFRNVCKLLTVTKELKKIN